MLFLTLRACFVEFGACFAGGLHEIPLPHRHH
jgi:hypothetical protein